MGDGMERRLGGERRRQDSGPPAGWRERRRSVERRRPDVGMVQVSDSDWEKYFGRRAATVAAPTTGGDPLEMSSTVFDRVRD